MVEHGVYSGTILDKNNFETKSIVGQRFIKTSLLIYMQKIFKKCNIVQFNICPSFSFPSLPPLSQSPPRVMLPRSSFLASHAPHVSIPALSGVVNIITQHFTLLYFITHAILQFPGNMDADGKQASLFPKFAFSALINFFTWALRCSKLQSHYPSYFFYLHVLRAQLFFFHIISLPTNHLFLCRRQSTKIFK